jgi:hypothetical protein
LLWWSADVGGRLTIRILINSDTEVAFLGAGGSMRKFSLDHGNGRCSGASSLIR